MKAKTRPIVVGVAISLLLLIAFGILKEAGARFLDLSDQWIFVAILPIVVALFVGGYITKFKGFGVELESALKAPIATIDLKAVDALADIPGDEKRSMMYLESMPREKALSVRRLAFTSGREGYYAPYAVREYLERLANIEYFEVKSKDGQFLCFLPLRVFKTGREMDPHERFDVEKIGQFLRSLEEGTLLTQFRDTAVTLTVKSTENLLQVLRALRDEQVEMAAVVSESGRYLGAVLSRDVEKRVSDAVLSSQAA